MKKNLVLRVCSIPINRKLILKVNLLILIIFAAVSNMLATAASDVPFSEPLQNVISGTIKDSETGQPMPGVNIIVKGTTIGAISDAAGKYSLSVADMTATIVCTFIGYVTQEIPLNGRTILDVSLSSELVGLNEVVVVGYGTVKRKDLTGSVQSVSSENLKDVSVTRVEQALIGKLAGVQIKPFSGQPGVAQQIRIRGIGSISASAEPLYVVDGFPTGDIQTINPNDIETIDILKDASASAIYGSRGSNGVIIISTKRGKEGAPVISFDTYYGIQAVEMEPVMMNSAELAVHAYDGVKNRNLDAGNDVSGSPDKWKLAVPQDILDVLNGTNTTDVNWLDQIMRVAPQQQYQLAVRGGDKNLKYAVSTEYFDQEGIIKNTNFQRYSLRANIDARLTNKLSIKVNLNPSFTNENIVTARGLTSGPNENVIGSAMAVTPLYPIYKDNGDYFPYNGLTSCGNFYHPIALVTDIKNIRKGIRVLGFLY